MKLFVIRPLNFLHFDDMSSNGVALCFDNMSSKRKNFNGCLTFASNNLCKYRKIYSEAEGIMLLDRDVKRLWNTLFNANVLVCGRENNTMVCPENV
jgi:hypothetical protein